VLCSKNLSHKRKMNTDVMKQINFFHQVAKHEINFLFNFTITYCDTPFMIFFSVLSFYSGYVCISSPDL
jgi:hypothetical protein